MRRIPVPQLLLLPVVALAACVLAPEDENLGEDSFGVTIPPRGTASTLDFGAWNVTWFGSTGNGPDDEALQLANARDVIGGTDLDIWGLAEIVSTTQFNALRSQLPGYGGFLASASNVTSGSAFYSAGEQKVGILFKSSIATVLSARLILTQNDSDFAGRPPLEVTLRTTLGGTTTDIVVIVVHAKAFADASSWQRRVNASAALKSFLDSTYPTQRVIVLGDFNDDVDTSILAGRASPYANFVSDAADYVFPTKALSDAGESSTTGHPDMVDHHLDTNEMHARFVAGSAEVYRVDELIPDYDQTTSDHFPVLTRYTSGGGGGSAQIVINEIRANEPGSSTAGEFVELLNRGTSAASIAGWTLSDATGVRHTFASGTSLGAGRAIAVYGGASGIPPGLENAVAASSGALSLNNTSDTATLRNGSGAIVDSFAYPSSLAGTDGVSMNRSPDGSTGSFVLHTSLSSLASSGGKRANGTDW